jgi:four helix bundle protein
MKAKCYRELIVWQKAMDLVVRLYQRTAHFPREEIYGLTNQLRRAVVSIPSNIAEGQARGTTKEFLHFLWIAKGSLAEVDTQILLADRLGYCDKTSANELLEQLAEVGRLLNGLQNSLS